MGVRRVLTAASLAAVALLAQGAGALAAIPPSADMAITMTGPATATAGTDITYLFTITNNGPDLADGVAINPTAPAHTNTVSFNFTLGGPSLTMAPGAITEVTWVVHIDATTPAGTVITNTLTISATTADPNPANNSATVLTTVGAGAQADLAVTKTADVSALIGDRFNSRIAVVNNGPQAALSVVVVDNLPAGLTGVTFAASGTSLQATDGCTNDLAGHITCHIAAMQLGQTFILDVSGIAAAAGDYTDTATGSSGTPDANPANNSASATTHVLNRPDDGDGRVGDDGGQSGNGDHGDRGGGDDNSQSGNGDHGDGSGGGDDNSQSGNGDHGDRGGGGERAD